MEIVRQNFIAAFTARKIGNKNFCALVGEEKKIRKIYDRRSQTTTARSEMQQNDFLVWLWRREIKLHLNCNSNKRLALHLYESFPFHTQTETLIAFSVS